MLKPGVKSKFLIGTIAIVLTVGLLMTVLVRIVLRESLHASHEARGKYIAQRLAQDSGGPMLTEKYFEIQMMLNDLKATEEDIAYIFVKGDDGEVLAHTFVNGFPEDLRALNDAGPGRSKDVLLESGQGLIHDFSAPLFRGVGGMVHVGLLEAQIYGEIDRAFILVLAGVLAAVVLGSGLAVVLAVSITRPIEDLVTAAGALEQGHLHARVSASTDDEIGRLALAFNSMAASRERAEEGLRASEQKLRGITASLGEGVLVVDTGGLVTFMNPEAERLIGWSEAELAGKSFHDIVHPRKQDGSHFPAAECPSLQVAMTGKQMPVDDDIYVRKDGTEIPVSHITAPIVEDGRIVGVVTAFQDITQRKRREAEREQLIMEHLDALSKVKVLSGMLPICSSCKKIRDDSGYWKQIESYVHEHSEAEFSHGICPECAVKLYPDHYKKNT